MEDNIHRIELHNRNDLFVFGVEEVASFDELSVVLNTVCGRINVDGADLHILALDLEKGEAVIAGRVDAVIYEDDQREKKKGFFGRLVR